MTNPASLGNLLVETGTLTPDQLKAALERQQEKPEAKLGEVVRELGYATVRSVDRALSIQEDLKKGDEASASLSKLEAHIEKMTENTKELATIIDLLPTPRPG